MRKRRIIMSIGGILLCALSAGVVKVGALGIDPVQALVTGLDKLLPIDFGTLSLLLNAAFLIFTLFTDRHYIGFLTIFTLLFYGYVTDFAYTGLLQLLPVPSILLRFLCLIIGTVGICFSASLFTAADLGVPAYDTISLVMAFKWKLGPFKFMRILTDSVCLVLAVTSFLSAGGSWREIPRLVGIGTVLNACCTGPLIDFFLRTVARPMLRDKN